MMSNNRDNNLTENNNNEKGLNRAKWMLVSPAMSNKMKWFWDHFKHYNLESYAYRQLQPLQRDYSQQRV